MVTTLSGIEHSMQTQLKRQEEERDTTKILAYKSEVKLAVWGARNLGQHECRLGNGVEGKELWRRLNDVAMFGGRQRGLEGKRYKLTKGIRGATVTARRTHCLRRRASSWLATLSRPVPTGSITTR